MNLAQPKPCSISFRFRLRAAGTDTSVTPNQPFGRLYPLPLKGVGVTVVLNETYKQFQLSVNKPN